MEKLQVLEERLLVARRRQKMTQEDLASKIQVFKTDISKYERGQSMPTLPRLMRLADALGVSMDWLCGRKETCELVCDPRQRHPAAVAGVGEGMA